MQVDVICISTTLACEAAGTDEADDFSRNPASLDVQNTLVKNGFGQIRVYRDMIIYIFYKGLFFYTKNPTEDNKKNSYKKKTIEETKQNKKRTGKQIELTTTRMES